MTYQVGDIVEFTGELSRMSREFQKDVDRTGNRFRITHLGSSPTADIARLHGDKCAILTPIDGYVNSAVKHVGGWTSEVDLYRYQLVNMVVVDNGLFEL